MALPTRIRLKVVSPARLIMSEDVDEVTIPGSEGYLGILPGHLPLLTLLGTGILTYRDQGMKHSLAVSGGFAEVLPERVIVIAETVELPKEIDVERARMSKEKAEKELHSKGDIDVDATMDALMRATTRIQVASQS